MKKILSLVRSAVDDYNMIETGDRVAVGVSGGKDSVLMLCALARLSRFYPKPFTVTAFTLDPCFADDTGVHRQGDYSQISALCEELGVPYIIKRSNIAEIVFDLRKEANPCSLCARMRRGALHDMAVENGFNKVALGHSLDDAAETFMLNLLNEKRIGCFSPVTYLSRKNITVIRPLIYATESEIKGFVGKLNLPVIKSMCPVNGFTRRETTKQLLKNLEHEYPGLRYGIITAMKKANIDRW